MQSSEDGKKSSSGYERRRMKLCMWTYMSLVIWSVHTYWNQSEDTKASLSCMCGGVIGENWKVHSDRKWDVLRGKKPKQWKKLFVNTSSCSRGFSLCCILRAFSGICRKIDDFSQKGLEMLNFFYVKCSMVQDAENSWSESCRQKNFFLSQPNASFCHGTKGKYPNYRPQISQSAIRGRTASNSTFWAWNWIIFAQMMRNSAVCP